MQYPSCFRNDDACRSWSLCAAKSDLGGRGTIQGTPFLRRPFKPAIRPAFHDIYYVFS